MPYQIIMSGEREYFNGVEQFAVIDDERREVRISCGVKLHLVPVAIRLACEELAGDAPDVRLVVSGPTPRVPLPPGWRWVSGCFLCRAQ